MDNDRQDDAPRRSGGSPTSIIAWSQCLAHDMDGPRDESPTPNGLLREGVQLWRTGGLQGCKPEVYLLPKICL